MRRPLTTHTYTHTKHISCAIPHHRRTDSTKRVMHRLGSQFGAQTPSSSLIPRRAALQPPMLVRRGCPFRCTRRALSCSDLRRDQLRPRRPFGQGRWRGRGRRSYQSTCARFGHRWCYRLMLLRRFCALSRDLINLPQAAERVRGFECLQLVAALALVHVCPGALNGARAHAAGAAPAS